MFISLFILYNDHNNHIEVIICIIAGIAGVLSSILFWVCSRMFKRDFCLNTDNKPNIDHRELDTKILNKIRELKSIIQQFPIDIEENSVV